MDSKSSQRSQRSVDIWVMGGLTERIVGEGVQIPFFFSDNPKEPFGCVVCGGRAFLLLVGRIERQAPLREYSGVSRATMGGYYRPRKRGL